MSERTLAEERTIDTNISTASLAGVEDRSRAEKGSERNTFKADKDRIALPAETATQSSKATEESTAPLFPGAEATELRSRWDAVQVGLWTSRGAPWNRRMGLLPRP